MDFSYLIKYWYEEGGYVERNGTGVFYPSDQGFKLEHMLWLMAEEFGRPEHIEVIWNFTGNGNGKTASERIEGPASTTRRC